MSEAKPTPGPWQVDESEDANGHRTIRMFDGTPNGDTNVQPIATVYAVGNARIIAAAPDLLTAARQSLDWLASYPGGGATGAYDALRAAIASAEGKG